MTCLCGKITLVMDAVRTGCTPPARFLAIRETHVRLRFFLTRSDDDPLDNHRGARNDIAYRGSSQRSRQSLQSDNQQSQLYSLIHQFGAGIRGNSFIEILLVLPVFLTIVFGSLGIFLWAQESYAAGQAAQIGVSEWASTGSLVTAQDDMNETLNADGYSPQMVRTSYIHQGSLDMVTVSLPFRAEFWKKNVSITASRSAVEETGTAGSGTQSWW